MKGTKDITKDRKLGGIWLRNQVPLGDARQSQKAWELVEELSSFGVQGKDGKVLWQLFEELSPIEGYKAKKTKVRGKRPLLEHMMLATICFKDQLSFGGYYGQSHPFTFPGPFLWHPFQSA